MATTSEDVARRAGVSRATVSQILNGRGQRFADTTRQRVAQAAAELEYQPSAAGRALALGSSDIVLAVIPNTTFGGNLQNIFQAATEELAARGLTLLLHLSTDSTTPLDRVVTGMKPRAVISLTAFTAAEQQLLANRGVKAFDPSTAGTPVNTDREIGAMQAQHLIERGYTRLGFAHLHDARQDPFGQGREAGVRETCRRHGLPEPSIVRLDIDPAGALAAIDSLDLPGMGVACYNDDVATALLSAALLRGWSIPQNLGLIGMDNTPLSAVTVPPLTTVGYDLRAAAYNLITSALSAIGEPVEQRDRADAHFQVVQRQTT